MDNITPSGITRGHKAGEQDMNPAAQEKYRVLSAKYDNDFYGYIGYVLRVKGREAWLKIAESIPVETVDVAVTAWIASGRP